MRVADWRSVEEGRLEVPKEVALTFGVFDGIHPGHRALFDLLEEKRGRAAPSVFTFRGNPQTVLRPHTYPGDVLSVRQKLERLDAYGIELVVLADFDDSFRTMPGTDFLAHLMDALNIRYAAVGPDFHCGRNMDTDARGVARYFSAHGVRVDIAGAVYHNGSPVSSTRIRQAVANGDFETARALLGGSFVLDLRDVSIETSRHEVWVPRSLVGQVVPFSGAFHSTVFTTDGPIEAVVHVDPEGLRLTGPNGNSISVPPGGISQIEFARKTGIGIEGERDVAYQRGKG
ncbi:MAG: FAD synthetase family protein [Spirochaetaceae bacterium]